jgi:general secretion pathway protein S
MQSAIRSFTAGIVTMLLLTGCQQRERQPQPVPATQVEQLSAVLAGGYFLRQNCARTDIPDDVKLQRTAIHIAQQRGWDIHTPEYQQLPARAQARYQALMQDSTPMQDKCAALNRSTARFVAAAQSEHDSVD